MFRLVVDSPLWDIGSLYWQNQRRHAPCGILKMSVNGASTVLGLAYFVIKSSWDLRVHNCNIDRLARQKYHISKVKYRYQITRYCQLLNKPKHIVGCWKCDLDKILLTHCKFKSRIWIYRWTRWATRWQPAQIRLVGSVPWNRTPVGSSGSLTTQTANLATAQFGPGPRHEVTVRNHC